MTNQEALVTQEVVKKKVNKLVQMKVTKVKIRPKQDQKKGAKEKQKN